MNDHSSALAAVQASPDERQVFHSQRTFRPIQRKTSAFHFSEGVPLNPKPTLPVHPAREMTRVIRNFKLRKCANRLDNHIWMLGRTVFVVDAVNHEHRIFDFG